MPNYYRTLANELRAWPSPMFSDDGEDEREFTYFPDTSVQALADGLCFGRYNGTGGERGYQENFVLDPAVAPTEALA
jgi:hypothetical protein